MQNTPNNSSTATSKQNKRNHRFKKKQSASIHKPIKFVSEVQSEVIMFPWLQDLSFLVDKLAIANSQLSSNSSISQSQSFGKARSTRGKLSSANVESSSELPNPTQSESLSNRTGESRKKNSKTSPQDKTEFKSVSNVSVSNDKLVEKSSKQKIKPSGPLQNSKSKLDSSVILSNSMLGQKSLNQKIELTSQAQQSESKSESSLNTSNKEHVGQPSKKVSKFDANNDKQGVKARKKDAEKPKLGGLDEKLSKERDSGETKKKPPRLLFDLYWSKTLVTTGIANGSLMEGYIRFHPRRRSLAFVATDDRKRDIVIIGSRDQNRSFQGDKVVVKLVGELKPDILKSINSGRKYFEKNGSGIQENKDLDETGCREDGGNTPPDDILDDHPYPVGYVVAITERRPGLIFSGSLVISRGKWDSGSVAMFKPSDKKCPLIILHTSQIPLSFRNNYNDNVCLVEVVKWPPNRLRPQGKFFKGLGQAGDIISETRVLIECNNISDTPFSEEVEKCLPNGDHWEIPQEEILARRDLRQERIFTIDPETARDLDDAISIKLLSGEFDGYEVGVHIADVSYFVKEGSELDKEAKKRATTTYLVQKAVPMLPRVLCENLCSLNPREDRLAFSVIWKMDREANVVKTWFGKTVIHSCIKLNYDQAQRLIDGENYDEVVQNQTIRSDVTEDQLISDIKNFHSLSKILRNRRFENGSVSFNQPRLSFKLDDECVFPTDCFVYKIKESNKLIEEFMLLANMSVATKISSYYPKAALLRCHPPPLEKGMLNFLKYAKKLGIEVDISTSKSLETSIRNIENEDLRHLINLQAIRPMQRAFYFSTGQFLEDQKKWFHYGLCVERYTHFTSPIRRYADIVVHRLLMSSINNKELPQDLAEEVVAIARHCNIKKEDARSAQEASSKLFLCIYLKRLESDRRVPLVEEAVVIDIGEKVMDVFIPSLGLEKRIFFEDSGAIKSVVNETKTFAILSWPKIPMKEMSESYEIPPYDGCFSLNRSVSTEFVSNEYHTVYLPKEEVYETQQINLLDKVRIRLVCLSKSPVDLKVYLIPLYVINTNNFQLLTEIKDDVKGKVSTYEEAIAEID